MIVGVMAAEWTASCECVSMAGSGCPGAQVPLRWQMMEARWEMT
jgi:hypothetical protein